MRIKSGQTWVNKKDGKLLYIGKKHDSVRWNCTDSISNNNHAITEHNIRKYYRLVDSDMELIETVAEQKDPVIVKKVVVNTIKQKPRFMPTFLYKYLLKMLVSRGDKVVKVK